MSEFNPGLTRVDPDDDSSISSSSQSRKTVLKNFVYECRNINHVYDRNRAASDPEMTQRRFEDSVDERYSMIDAGTLPKGRPHGGQDHDLITDLKKLAGKIDALAPAPAPAPSDEMAAMRDMMAKMQAELHRLTNPSSLIGALGTPEPELEPESPAGACLSCGKDFKRLDLHTNCKGARSQPEGVTPTNEEIN